MVLVWRLTSAQDSIIGHCGVPQVMAGLRALRSRCFTAASQVRRSPLNRVWGLGLGFRDPTPPRHKLDMHSGLCICAHPCHASTSCRHVPCVLAACCLLYTPMASSCRPAAALTCILCAIAPPLPAPLIQAADPTTGPHQCTPKQTTPPPILSGTLTSPHPPVVIIDEVHVPYQSIIDVDHYSVRIRQVSMSSSAWLGTSREWQVVRGNRQGQRGWGPARASLTRTTTACASDRWGG